MKLMREVLKLEGHSRVSITAVFYFIDFFLRLPEELAHEFTETIGPIIKKEEQIMVQFEKNDLPPTIADLFKTERKEGIKQGIEQGREQGREQGIEQSNKNFALALLRENFEVDYLAKLTGLTVAEVEKLKKTLM